LGGGHTSKATHRLKAFSLPHRRACAIEAASSCCGFIYTPCQYLLWIGTEPDLACRPSHHPPPTDIHPRSTLTVSSPNYGAFGLRLDPNCAACMQQIASFPSPYCLYLARRVRHSARQFSPSSLAGQPCICTLSAVVSFVPLQ
jgi:hypothetical protein